MIYIATDGRYDWRTRVLQYLDVTNLIKIFSWRIQRNRTTFRTLRRRYCCARISEESSSDEKQTGQECAEWDDSPKIIEIRWRALHKKSIMWGMCRSQLLDNIRKSDVIFIRQNPISDGTEMDSEGKRLGERPEGDEKVSKKTHVTFAREEYKELDRRAGDAMIRSRYS